MLNTGSWFMLCQGRWALNLKISMAGAAAVANPDTSSTHTDDFVHLTEQ